MNSKWHETRTYLDSLSIKLEKSYLGPKAVEELATLRDVHEGYQRYINSAESLSTDAQKLNLQLETNKVRFMSNIIEYFLQLNGKKIRIFIYIYFQIYTRILKNGI